MIGIERAINAISGVKLIRNHIGDIVSSGPFKGYKQHMLKLECTPQGYHNLVNVHNAHLANAVSPKCVLEGKQDKNDVALVLTVRNNDDLQHVLNQLINAITNLSSSELDSYSHTASNFDGYKSVQSLNVFKDILMVGDDITSNNNLSNKLQRLDSVLAITDDFVPVKNTRLYLDCYEQLTLLVDNEEREMILSAITDTLQYSLSPSTYRVISGPVGNDKHTGIRVIINKLTMLWPLADIFRELLIATGGLEVLRPYTGYRPSSNIAKFYNADHPFIKPGYYDIRDGRVILGLARSKALGQSKYNTKLSDLVESEYEYLRASSDDYVLDIPLNDMGSDIIPELSRLIKELNTKF